MTTLIVIAFAIILILLVIAGIFGTPRGDDNDPFLGPS